MSPPQVTPDLENATEVHRHPPPVSPRQGSVGTPLYPQGPRVLPGMQGLGCPSTPQCWLEVEGTRHSGGSQSKGTRKKRGARRGRKDTLHPGCFPVQPWAPCSTHQNWGPALGHAVTPWAPSERRELGAGGKTEQPSRAGSEEDKTERRMKAHGKAPSPHCPELRGPRGELSTLTGPCAA